MNFLSYVSLTKQSLVRYDKANAMLHWASSGMSDTQLNKYNFRRLKKFLENKGWVYTRKYSFKGKRRCTESLVDIVRQEALDKLNRPYGSIDPNSIKVIPIKSHFAQSVCRTDRELLAVEVRTMNVDLIPKPNIDYGNCTKLEQEPELPIHSVKSEPGPDLLSIVPGKVKTVRFISQVEEVPVAVKDRPHDSVWVTAGLNSAGEPALFNQYGNEIKPCPDDLTPLPPIIGYDPANPTGDYTTYGCNLTSLMRQQTSNPTPKSIEQLLKTPRGFDKKKD